MAQAKYKFAFYAKTYLTFIVLVSASVLFNSCIEVNTTDPESAYKHWTGAAPPSDLKLLKAQYWQSPHWTKEYILYFEILPTKRWWHEYVEANHLTIDTASWTPPEQVPTWFRPSNNCIKYNLSAYSAYFRDTISGHCYIYEMQL